MKVIDSTPYQRAFTLEPGETLDGNLLVAALCSAGDELTFEEATKQVSNLFDSMEMHLDEWQQDRKAA